MYWISRYLDPWPWPIFHASVTFTNFTSMFHYHWAVSCMIRKVSAEDIAIRGNGTGPEYMCPTRHFVYIFFNPVFQVSTAKNEINLFNNHVLIVAPVTFAPAGAMTPSAEFLFFWKQSAGFKSRLWTLLQTVLLTLVLLNPDIPCLCKQCRSRSVGFWRSQLIWICTVCHYVFEFTETIRIK